MPMFQCGVFSPECWSQLLCGGKGRHQLSCNSVQRGPGPALLGPVRVRAGYTRPEISTCMVPMIPCCNMSHIRSTELGCCWAMHPNMAVGSSPGLDSTVAPLAIQLSDTNRAIGCSLDSEKQISILKNLPASHLLVANVVGMRTKAANHSTADSCHSGWGGPPVSDSWCRFSFFIICFCVCWLLCRFFLCSCGCTLVLLSLVVLQEGPLG